jgi:acetylornithine deacetylase/succinyl-diaminopimelate desuccinylase-like protein
MEITNDQMQEWLSCGDSKEYFELLKFVTVAAQASHLRDCVQCATWLKKWLRGIGAEAELVLPVGKASAHPVPVLSAEIKGEEGSPTVLFYGHYDVQPADPEDKWETPPFEPSFRDGRVYCRGAQDDKGQAFAFLCGVREWVKSGRKNINLKILLEGQEESGSAGLFSLLEESSFRRRLAADVMLVSDTSAAANLRPAIVAGIRGVNHFTVKLTAASRDLHSGEYGGVAPNAAQGMCELLSSLHAKDGSIAVEGFMDGVAEPTADELEKSSAAFASEEEARKALENDIGAPPSGGERSKSIARRLGFEPTIEVNGVHSGYGGPGSKTVIPCEAIAKISTRLVSAQNPRRTFEVLKEHFLKHCPEGMEVSFPEDSGLSAAMKLPVSSPIFAVAEEVLTEMDSRGPLFMWSGASIPVVSALKETSGAAALLVGWGQPDDCIHSPNESFSVRQFLLAKEWAKRILEKI